MKAFIVFSVILAVLAPSLAQDDGRYRPEQYGDDGRYRPSYEGQYREESVGFRAVPTSPRVYNDYQNYRVSAVRPVENIRTVRPVVVAQPVYTQNVAAPVQVQQAAGGRYAEAYATILRDVKDVDINAYHYLYETSNGIGAEESGRIDSDISGTEARGFFEYVGDDGVKYRVEYTAGADGFRPVGAHIPA